MFYYKKGNNTFALKTKPTKAIEEEVEKHGKKVKIKKFVIDDSYTPITEKEFNDLNKARLHK